MKRSVALIGTLALNLCILSNANVLCGAGEKPQPQLKLVKEITLEKPMVHGISFPNDNWKAIRINYDGLLKGEELRIFVNTGNGVLFLNSEGELIFKREFGVDEIVGLYDDGQYFLVVNRMTFDARMETKDGNTICKLKDNRFCMMSRGVLLTLDGRMILLPVDYDRPSKPRNRLQFFDKTGRLVVEGDLNASMFQDGHNLIASLSPEGNYLGIIGSVYQKDSQAYPFRSCLFFYDAKSGKELWHRYLPGWMIDLVQVTKAGKRIIAASSPGFLGDFRFYFYDKNGNLLQEHKIGGPPIQAVLSGDGSISAIISRKFIHLFDTETNGLIWEYREKRKEREFQSLALSYDGGTAVASLYGEEGNRYLYVFNRQGSLIISKKTPLFGLSLELTPDAKKVIIGERGTQVNVYQLRIK